MSLETPQSLTLYSFSSSNLKGSLHSSRLPFDEAAGEIFIRSLPESMVCGQKEDCRVKGCVHLATGEFSSRGRRGLISIPQRP